MENKKPKFILSKSKVLEQYNILKQLNLRISYSLKTNKDVAKILEQNTDSEFSTHSFEGLNYVEDKTKTWFLPQGWNEEQIQFLLNQKVTKFVIDNTNDLEKLKIIAQKNYEENKQKIDVLIRTKMKENTIFTGRYYVYGIDTQKTNEIIKQLKQLEYINQLGVHFHRKTQNISEWDIYDEIQDSLTCLDEIDILNIGGGLPVKYKNTGDFSLEHILKKISELKNFLEKNNIQLMIEPGRFIAAPSVQLETQIINKIDKNLIINASVYNSSPDIIIYSIKLLTQNEIESNKSNQQYLIKGNTACSMDIFRYKVYYDKEPKIGDTITFLNAGAYNYHTNFMFLKEIETIIID